MADFLYTVDINFLIECGVKILLSVTCGFALGIERKSRNQVVGTRTLILISVSSALLSILSYYMAEQGVRRGFTGGDPTRIVAGVVSGIGFVGGGAIMRQGLNIKGLTSAAIIWTASALGLSLGAGLYVQAIAVLVLVMFTLVGLEKVEDRWFPAGRNKTLHLMFDNDNISIQNIKKILEEAGMVVADVNLSRDLDRHQTILRFSVKTPREENYPLIIERLQGEGKLGEFSITD